MKTYTYTKGESMDDQDYPGDKDLIAGLIQGDRQSADNLVRKYQGRLLVFLEHRMNLPLDVAQELLQKIFAKLIINPSIIRPGTDRLDRFFFVACKNAAIDHHRKRKREEEQFADVVEELLSAGEIHDPWVASPVVFPEPHIVLLRQSLSGLDQKKRQVLRMFAERVPDKEVARILDEDEGTIRQRRSRALADVRERYLNQLNNQPPDVQEKIRKKLKLD